MILLKIQITIETTNFHLFFPIRDTVQFHAAANTRHVYHIHIRHNNRGIRRENEIYNAESAHKLETKQAN